MTPLKFKIGDKAKVLVGTYKNTCGTIITIQESWNHKRKLYRIDTTRFYFYYFSYELKKVKR